MTGHWYDPEIEDPPDERGRRAGTWYCPDCNVTGQTWLHHETATDLAAHRRICHGAAAAPRDERDPFL